MSCGWLRRELCARLLCPGHLPCLWRSCQHDHLFFALFARPWQAVRLGKAVLSTCVYSLSGLIPRKKTFGFVTNKYQEKKINKIFKKYFMLFIVTWAGLGSYSEHRGEKSKDWIQIKKLVCNRILIFKWSFSFSNEQKWLNSSRQLWKKILLLFLPDEEDFVSLAEMEDSLLRNLFKGYQKWVRPVQHSNDTITVRFGLKISQLVDVVRRLKAWFRMKKKGLRKCGDAKSLNLIGWMS